MLITDLKRIGENLRIYRKQQGLTQFDVAEAAGLSSRAYTDIERGTANTRIETFIKICNVLNVTPDMILMEEIKETPDMESIISQLNNCNKKERLTAIKLMDTYLKSI